MALNTRLFLKKRIVALKKERIEIDLFLSVLRGVRSVHES